MTYIDLDIPTKMLLVDGGHTTVEALEAEQSLYDAFIVRLNLEWPSDRIKAFMLEDYRERCRMCLEKEKVLEIENKDARRMGMSFTERRVFTERIKGIRQLFNEYRDVGLRVKKGSFSATDLVTPSDMALINTHGFEYVLRRAII